MDHVAKILGDSEITKCKIPLLNLKNKICDDARFSTADKGSKIKDTELIGCLRTVIVGKKSVEDIYERIDNINGEKMNFQWKNSLNMFL